MAESAETKAGMVGKVLSLQVGMPQNLKTGAGKTWNSAIVKNPVQEPLLLEQENFVGDYQANRKHHGGPEKAVCWFSAEHFPELRNFSGIDLPFGAFGENITLTGLTEDQVCVGDIWQVGDTVRVQVTQPRQPCASITKRWGCKTLPDYMIDHGFTGFYTRVLQTGNVSPDAAVTLLERPHEGWTVERANRIMYGEKDLEEIRALRQVELLSDEWKRSLSRKAGE